ncbi:hypothetical protein HAU11_03875 [Weissella confusa]|uniref:hypothetical protein n=1 Tax=Weissella confusa TaxID=1583 RepID=UPI0018F112B0|nr:hypothetical protein [Weissella confusa]MBJ7640749.1 hypothetical protein [Weissella confusa]
MKNLKKDTDVAMYKSQKAAQRQSEVAISKELSEDEELREMTLQIVGFLKQEPASYVKKERALKLANELLFTKLVTTRRG